MKVVISDAAEAKLRSIQDHIAERDPRAAERVMHRIAQVTRMLGDFEARRALGRGEPLHRRQRPALSHSLPPHGRDRGNHHRTSHTAAATWGGVG